MRGNTLFVACFSSGGSYDLGGVRMLQALVYCCIGLLVVSARIVVFRLPSSLPS